MHSTPAIKGKHNPVLLVSYVPPEDVPFVYPRIRHWVARALKKGTGSDNTESVFQALCSGAMGLVVFKDGSTKEKDILACAIARVVNYDNFDALQVVAVAGEDYQDWSVEMDHMLVGWALANNCRRLESFSRPGSEKILHQRGYKTLCYVMAKEI